MRGLVSESPLFKSPATAVSKYDNRASVPALGRRLFLCRFTPFHLRFRHLLPVFQDGKVRGGIRGNGRKDLSLSHINERDQGPVSLSYSIQTVQELFAGAGAQAIFFPHQERGDGKRRLKWGNWSKGTRAPQAARCRARLRTCRWSSFPLASDSWKRTLSGSSHSGLMCATTHAEIRSSVSRKLPKKSAHRSSL